MHGERVGSGHLLQAAHRPSRGFQQGLARSRHKVDDGPLGVLGGGGASLGRELWLMAVAIPAGAGPGAGGR